MRKINLLLWLVIIFTLASANIYITNWQWWVIITSLSAIELTAIKQYIDE